MLKLALFGATGKTGRHLLEQALTGGHEVTVLVRDPSKLTQQHERLQVVPGDISDGARVQEVVAGADAVVSALGQTRTSTKDVLTVAARNIIPAMKKHGVRRLVSLVGAGVPDPGDPSSLGRSFMRGLMKLVVRHVLEDAEQHAALVRASGLDWVLIRPPRLTDGPRVGSYRTGILQLGPKASISRADLADFMLKQTTSDEYVHQAPMASY